MVRNDLKMQKGKIASQVSHASVESVLISDKKVVETWRDEGMKKIILKVKDEKELLDFKRKAEREGLKTALIRDAGLTVFEKPTITCMAIGPDDDGRIDKITKDLKLL